MLQRVPTWRWAALWTLIVLAIYSASMASTGAWDPWETHYGEVARQILMRQDPIDLWWKPGNGGPHGNAENVFWSKPALSFWCLAISMKVFGVGTNVGDPSELVRGLWPELALRTPSMLGGLLSAAFLGYVVARMVAPRAGILTALVLVTMPQWALVTRQAMTDMFLVGPVVLAMGAWALAWLQEDRELRTRGRGWREIPWDRAYVAFAMLFVLAVVTPLLVMHLHTIDGDTVARIRKWRGPYLGRLQTVSMHLWIYWVMVLAVVVASLRWRRRSQACMGLVYLAAGLACLGKGLIGPGLIGAICVAHLLVSGRWEILRRGALPVGILIFVLVCFPWHHAMILFRGERFVNEWIVQNNLQRFATGEQKQAVGSFTFYVRTMGLAALPWAAVAPLALWHAILAHRPGAAKRPTSSKTCVELHRFATLWFVVSLWALTYSVTKYYHYMLPCLPPLAVLVGVWADDLLGRPTRERGTWPILAVGCVLALSILALVVRDTLHEPAWIAHLTTYLYTGMWKKGAPEVTRLIWVSIPFGVGVLLMVAWRTRAAVAAMLLSALLTTTYIIDDYLPAASESWSQRSAMRVYFENRGPNDRLVSWWFYYRGETWFSKRDIWVMKDPSRDGLKAYVTEREGKGGTLWFITTVGHAKRLRSYVPPKYRDDLRTVYESFHYSMMTLQVP